ncbi:hypothetical protein GTU99_24665 [Streptomyces sp. PRKS01-65]|nr:hypothetical protein [Streptomyces harenosi]
MVWLLNGPDAGELTGASVQAAVGVAALLWALVQPPAGPTDDTAVRTGRVDARRGGTGVSGIRRPGGRGSGPARAHRTGPVTAHDDGSRGVSGIDYTG